MTIKRFFYYREYKSPLDLCCERNRGGGRATLLSVDQTMKNVSRRHWSPYLQGLQKVYIISNISRRADTTQSNPDHNIV